MVELVLEFNPMETQGMKEGAECLHHEQNESGGKGKNNEPDQPDDNIVEPANHHHQQESLIPSIWAHQENST